MKIKILTFGIARDIVGSREFILELAEMATTSDLRELLHATYPSLSGILQYSFAVNQSYIHDNSELHDMDEVAIIPPVSGG